MLYTAGMRVPIALAFLQVPKKAPIKFLCEQIPALRGTRNLDYLGDMSWLPRDLRLALYLPQAI